MIVKPKYVKYETLHLLTKWLLFGSGKKKALRKMNKIMKDSCIVNYLKNKNKIVNTLSLVTKTVNADVYDCVLRKHGTRTFP